jgi:hypothetical protein
LALNEAACAQPDEASEPAKGGAGHAYDPAIFRPVRRYRNALTLSARVCTSAAILIDLLNKVFLVIRVDQNQQGAEQ